MCSLKVSLQVFSYMNSVSLPKKTGRLNMPSLNELLCEIDRWCKTVQERTTAKFSVESVDALLKVLHTRPIAPYGLDTKFYPLALDNRVLGKEQERTTIAVAARYYCYEDMSFVLFF